MNNKDRTTLLTVSIIVATILFYAFGNLSEFHYPRHSKYKIEYALKVGSQLVIGGDTLIITDYNLDKKIFILSDNREVDAKKIL